MKPMIIIPCYEEERVLHEINRHPTEPIDSMITEGLLKECDILYVDDGSKGINKITDYGISISARI